MKRSRIVLFAAFVLAMFAVLAVGQQPTSTPEMIARRNAVEAELQSIAVVERKVMVPMRDGKRMQADVYRPKDSSKKYPIILSRTPYNFNWWDVRLGAPRDMTTMLDAVKRGYAYIIMNERGRFFRGKLRHPWPADYRWRRCDDVDVFTRLVE